MGTAVPKVELWAPAEPGDVTGIQGVKRPLPPGYGTARSLDRFPPKTAENGLHAASCTVTDKD